MGRSRMRTLPSLLGIPGEILRPANGRKRMKTAKQCSKRWPLTVVVSAPPETLVVEAIGFRRF